MTLPLSTFIIARNEADRIGPVIEAAQKISSEVIVVDSGSTDATVAVAEAAGARVVHNDWPGYGPQKRFAETLCANDWLLNLDADEVLSRELSDEIREMFGRGRPPADAFTIPIVEMYPGESRPAPFAYALSPVRLYRVSKGRYADSTVYDRVMLEDAAKVGSLRHPIHHYSVRSLREEAGKLLGYADAQAQAAENAGRRVSALRMISEFPLAFLKAYILRRHFLRGAYGYAIAINYAYYRHMRIVQFYERARQASR